MSKRIDADVKWPSLWSQRNNAEVKETGPIFLKAEAHAHEYVPRRSLITRKRPAEKAAVAREDYRNRVRITAKFVPRELWPVKLPDDKICKPEIRTSPIAVVAHLTFHAKAREACRSG